MFHPKNFSVQTLIQTTATCQKPTRLSSAKKKRIAAEGRRPQRSHARANLSVDLLNERLDGEPFDGDSTLQNDHRLAALKHLREAKVCDLKTKENSIANGRIFLCSQRSLARTST